VRERGLCVDHVTVWRWVQRYAPEIERRLRPHLKPTNKSWRVDETYIRVKGKWTYLYRAVDSTGASIDFLLSARRNAAAKRFFQKALSSPNHPTPRVINVDKNPPYPPIIEELKSDGTLRRRCHLRPVRDRTCRLAQMIRLQWNCHSMNRGSSLPSQSASTI
jgi:transposase-like protein